MVNVFETFDSFIVGQLRNPVCCVLDWTISLSAFLK